MKKFMLLGTLVAVVIAALSIPALAQDGFVRGVDDRELFREALQEAWEDDLDSWEDQAEDQGHEFDEDLYEGLFDNYFNTLADFYGFGGDEYWGDDEQWDEGSYYGVGQSFEQEAESGDVNQSFNVSGGGDNSNQCVGIQGVANTGNAQNQVGVIQYGSAAEDFEFEDVGSSITVSPSNSTSCDQRVNQAASASG